MSGLVLRRGTVVRADESAGEQRLVVDVVGLGRRAAVADVGLHGRGEPGDDVVVNVQAVELGLGSGGADVLHVNLTRGLAGRGRPGAHVMKLGYTGLQHAVTPVEGAELTLPLRTPVVALALHGQLGPVLWALRRGRPDVRVGYVQGPGGALPGGRSQLVRRLRAEGALAAHVTAGPAHGGEEEAMTVAGALHHGAVAAGWDVALVGPGPGIVGSASALGHGGLAALDAAHAALSLGAPTWLCARASSADPRRRHRGLSHHTRTVLALLLAPVRVAMPTGTGADVPAGGAGHVVEEVDVDLEGYLDDGGDVTVMGREDRHHVAVALAAGVAVARASGGADADPADGPRPVDG